MNKSYRQGQIIRLIKTHRILTQEQLAQELKAVGVSTTQVTLSRDIRELRLVKTSGGYQQVEGNAIGPAIATIMAEFLWEARAAQNLLVLKTSPGHASSVAIALDQEDWPEVVGTLAGDDTVLVIAPDNRTAAALRLRLLEYLQT
jgi:transcriptional regulator of arginine metabolism